MLQGAARLYASPTVSVELKFPVQLVKIGKSGMIRWDKVQQNVVKQATKCFISANRDKVGIPVCTECEKIQTYKNAWYRMLGRFEEVQHCLIGEKPR